jgi:hypothetical protein
MCVPQALYVHVHAFACLVPNSGGGVAVQLLCFGCDVPVEHVHHWVMADAACAFILCPQGL